MEYNTVRSKLLMPEYGRSVQEMVQYLLTIEDREKRSRYAQAIVEMMALLNPHFKTMEDYKHKLWDHLHQIAGLQLDVDAPYPPPSPEELKKRPDPIKYPRQSKINRHLGRNLSAFIKKGMEDPDQEKRQGYTQSVGYYMKLAYTNWHREPIHDDMIRTELAQLTDGGMQYEPGGFKVHFDARQAVASTTGTSGFKRNQGNNRNYKNQHGQQRNQGGGNPQQRSANANVMPQAPAGNYNGFNKNRKFNKNKGKTP